jgi:hypothetical protein
MAAQQRDAGAREVPGAESDVTERVLFELEQRYNQLLDELETVEARLRELRTAAEVCPLCGGLGRRRVRGGLYGEFQQVPCQCSESEPKKRG